MQRLLGSVTKWRTETWEAVSAFAGAKLARAALKPEDSCRAADTCHLDDRLAGSLPPVLCPATPGQQQSCAAGTRCLAVSIQLCAMQAALIQQMVDRLRPGTSNQEQQAPPQTGSSSRGAGHSGSSNWGVTVATVDSYQASPLSCQVLLAL